MATNIDVAKLNDHRGAAVINHTSTFQNLYYNSIKVNGSHATIVLEHKQTKHCKGLKKMQPKVLLFLLGCKAVTEYYKWKKFILRNKNLLMINFLLHHRSSCIRMV